MSEALRDVREIARAHGFDVVGVTSGDVLTDALAALETWVAAGHAADMVWMGRNPIERADPTTLLASVRSVITLVVRYGEHVPPFESEARYGRVARYAWGVDYHDVVIPRLRSVGAELVERLGAGRFAVACDHSPLLERAAAARAGLGFVGKNTCLLQPRRGSWFFLAEILLDAVVLPTPRSDVEDCGTCVRCLDACPTDAFPAPYVLDARRCISYLTIEHKGVVPHALRPAIGAWVFGCDACQEICPFNRYAPETSWPALGRDAGVGDRLDLAEVLSIRTDEAFRERFRGTALLRPKRRGLLRNAAVAARNVDARDAVPALERCVRDDPEPLVRAHALWALWGLDVGRARSLVARCKDDPDADVRHEALRGERASG